MASSKRFGKNFLAIGTITVALFFGRAATAEPVGELNGSLQDIITTLDATISIGINGTSIDTDEPVFIMLNSGQIPLRLEIVSERIRFENDRSIIILEPGNTAPVTRIGGSTLRSIAVPVRVLNARVNGERPIAYVIQCGPWDGVSRCRSITE